MSLNPKLWGDSMWNTMYAVALTSPLTSQPSQHKIALKKFYESLCLIIPCDECKQHYADLYKKIPINLNNRNSLLEWVNKIHNEINKITGDDEVSLDSIKKKFNYKDPSDQEIARVHKAEMADRHVQIKKQQMNRRNNVRARPTPLSVSNFAQNSNAIQQNNRQQPLKPNVRNKNFEVRKKDITFKRAGGANNQINVRRQNVPTFNPNLSMSKDAQQSLVRNLERAVAKKDCPGCRGKKVI